MPAPVALPHPRKLYSNVRACPSPEARAQAVLEGLLSATGSRSGFLLLWRDGGLAISAALPDEQPPAGLIQAALQAWNQHPKTARSDNTTVDLRGHMKSLTADQDESPWVSKSGVSFAHRVLTIDRDSRWIPLGIAMIEREPSQVLLPLRRAHVEAMGDALFDAGDVQGLELVPQPA